MSERFGELRALSDDELETRYDLHAANASAGVGFYREEFARRRAERQGDRMVEMTDDIRRLTVHVRNLTWAAVIIALASLTVAIVAVVIAVNAT